MARRRRYRRRSNPGRRRSRGSRKIPILPLIGAGASLFINPGPEEGYIAPIDEFKKGEWGNGVKGLVKSFTGYSCASGKWDLMKAPGLQVFVGTVLLSKFLSFFGVNRAFSRAPSPLNKLKF